MQFLLWLEQRQKGRSLPETGFKYRYATIYRAVKQGVNEFSPMDYVTLSRKFAKGHADHQFAVEEEPYVVLKAFVPAKDVFEAYNPEEYFYDGPGVQGKIIYTAKS